MIVKSVGEEYGVLDLSNTEWTPVVGDRVRISHLRKIFTREYDEKWSGEIFVVSERRLRGGLPIYRLKDYLEDEIKGTFYQAELQKVTCDVGPRRSTEDRSQSTFAKIQ